MSDEDITVSPDNLLQTVEIIKEFHDKLDDGLDGNTAVLLTLKEHVGTLETTLDGKIDSVEAALKGDIDTLETTLDGKIDSVEAALKGDIGTLETTLDGKIDSVEAALKGDIDTLETTLDGKIDSVETALKGDIETLETTLDGKIDSVETALKGDIEQAQTDAKDYTDEQLDNYVAKEAGKGLSEANYTTGEKEKLAGLENCKSELPSDVAIDADATPSQAGLVRTSCSIASFDGVLYRSHYNPAALAWQNLQDTDVNLNNFRNNGEWLLGGAGCVQALNFPAGTWTGTGNESHLKVILYEANETTEAGTQTLSKRGSDEVWRRRFTTATAFTAWKRIDYERP